jgi:UTP--glucose-1-phosphate uridylyltransferase
MIKCAIVPVAGFGTRLLPATKSQPKEMLPVARKPIVQYVVEELVASSVEEILFVTGRNKSSIENHFDQDPELTRLLSEANKLDLLEELRFEELQAQFYYTRQRFQRGLGDAVLCGESFASERPFVVALGDSILGLHANSNLVARMSALFQSSRASCVIAVEEVPPDQISHYGVIAPAGEDRGGIRVSDLVEKPTHKTAPSNLAIAGRYIFSPLIFDMIRQVKPDARGEIQLTDAIRGMCQEGKRVLAVKLAAGEKRYDIGNFPSYFETFVEFALADPVHGAQFRRTVERLLEESRQIA